MWTPRTYKYKANVYAGFLDGEVLWKAVGHVEAIKKAKTSRTTFFRVIRNGKPVQKTGITIDVIGEQIVDWPINRS